MRWDVVLRLNKSGPIAAPGSCVWESEVREQRLKLLLSGTEAASHFPHTAVCAESSGRIASVHPKG